LPKWGHIFVAEVGTRILAEVERQLLAEVGTQLLAELGTSLCFIAFFEEHGTRAFYFSEMLHFPKSRLRFYIFVLQNIDISRSARYVFINCFLSES
jgi:hypothetical protein